MTTRKTLLTATVLTGAFALIPSSQAMNLIPGDFYTSSWDSNIIRHLNSAGNLVDTFTVSSTYGTAVRGLTFGANGELYTVMEKSGTGYNVIAINNSGTVQQTYSGTDFLGNISNGKIEFGSGGQCYVTAGDNLMSFTSGNPTGTSIFTNNQVFDAKRLSSGNLLVVSAYNLDEITSTGTLVRHILNGAALTDARGVEYDAATNKIYLSMLGDSSGFFKILKINGTTGAIETSATFNYADDLLRTADGRYIAGSRTQAPGIFDQNLNQIGTLGTQQQMFVTQMSPVPEPASLLALGLGAVALLRRRRK